MTQEEHNAVIEQIRTATSDVERSTLLLNLTNDYTQMLNTNKELTTQNEKLEKDNTEYAKLNNSLFLQLGNQNKNTNQNNDNQNNDNPNNEQPKKLSFDDLKFDND